MSAVEAFDQATAIVKATWSDVTKLYRPSAGTWINWLEEIEKGNLVLPFAVVAPLDVTPAEGFGLDVKAYYGGFAAWYIRDSPLTAAEKASYDHVQQILDPKGAALQDALINHAATAPTAPKFQIVDLPSVDSSQLNPANQIFHEKPYEYWSTMVSARLLFGETY